MKKILIIEDDLNLSELYETKFSLDHFTVLTATDGKSGIKLAAKQQPDIILLDILMPKINGFEVLKKLNKQTETKDIPVIVYTNLGSGESDEQRELAYSLGAADYLVKALHEPETIVKRVEKLLKSRKA